jgi:hypothetical protein
MSDRPSAVNGKRHRAWGTRDNCPACGRCLCFGCHPLGPCVDEYAGPGAPTADSPLAFTSGSSSPQDGWFASAAPGASGLRMRAASPPSADVPR